MNRALENRLRKLEAATNPDDSTGVHAIPAHTEEEFQAKRAAMIEAGTARPRDWFVHLQRFAEPAEPVTVSHSLDELLADIAANGRRIFDPRPETTT